MIIKMLNKLNIRMDEHSKKINRVRKYKEEANKAEENNNWNKYTQEVFKIKLNIMKNRSVTGRQINRNHSSWTTTKNKTGIKKGGQFESSEATSNVQTTAL